jgi:hypothetical protein
MMRAWRLGMDWLRRVLTVGLGLFALTAAGCGKSDDDEPKCTTPSVKGTPFGFEGTAVVRGNGMLPAGAGADGDVLNLLVDTGAGSYGLLPMNVTDLINQPLVCGRGFSFELDQMEAGTYRLDYEIRASASDTEPTAMGTSTNEFTVADGADVEFEPTF